MNNMILALLAFVPMVWLLFSLGVLKIASQKACFIAVVLASVIAFGGYHMSIKHVGQSIIEGGVYSLLSICWVILAALLVYNITLKTGALDIIQKMLYSISPDRRIQALIIAFAFGGFLEAVAGFGTAVAIPAGILIAMGFAPLKAAIVCLVANTVPVAFGVLGVPIQTLAQVSELEVGKLAYNVCIQLFLFAVILPVLLVYIVTGKITKIKGVFIVSSLSGLAFAIGQTLTAIYVGVELAAIVGSLSALALLIVWCKVFPIKVVYKFEKDSKSNAEIEKIRGKDAIVAWLPYLLVLVFIILIQVFPIVRTKLFILSYQFYYGENGKRIQFNWLTSGGTVLFFSAVITAYIQGMKMKEFFVTCKETLYQVKNSFITIILVVSLAKIMTYSGMVETSASFIAMASGKFFPLISPFIGAIGTFITGSDTSSNILFGDLQKQTAIKLNLDQYWIVAGNGSGATAGKMISPQSISIAASSIDHKANESEMMKHGLKYCMLYVISMGLFVFFIRI